MSRARCRRDARQTRSALEFRVREPRLRPAGCDRFVCESRVCNSRLRHAVREPRRVRQPRVRRRVRQPCATAACDSRVCDRSVCDAVCDSRVCDRSVCDSRAVCDSAPCATAACDSRCVHLIPSYLSNHPPQPSISTPLLKRSGQRLEPLSISLHLTNAKRREVLPGFASRVG